MGHVERQRRANSLWLTEWLTATLDLRVGMRVLDLGCGRASSSIFLHREFGVLVWATDLWFNVSENAQRIRDAGVGNGVFPIHADARSLPFGLDFFDAIVCIDSFVYYGTDDLYLNYLARFVKPGGQVGIAGAGLMQEIEGPFPSIFASGGPTISGAFIRRPGGGDPGSGRALWTLSWPIPCPMAGDCGWTGTKWWPLTMQQKSTRLRLIVATTLATFALWVAVGVRRSSQILSCPCPHSTRKSLCGGARSRDFRRTISVNSAGLAGKISQGDSIPVSGPWLKKIAQLE
jgi:SAM-dependent methyltransferase